MASIPKENQRRRPEPLADKLRQLKSQVSFAARTPTRLELPVLWGDRGALVVTCPIAEAPKLQLELLRIASGESFQPKPGRESGLVDFPIDGS
jgi:hypothetical protein